MPSYKHSWQSSYAASLVETALLIVLGAIIALAAIKFVGKENADTFCKAGATISVEGREREVFYSEEFRCCGFSVTFFGATGFTCISE